MGRLSDKTTDFSLGFTLTELLIVVSIVGILATIGIPTYKRMIQKARQSEAKVALGSLAAAETSFFAEFGTFGNNLPQLGFEMAEPKYYGIGFADTDTCIGDGDIEPGVTQPVLWLQERLPQYYIRATFVPFYKPAFMTNAHMCVYTPTGGFEREYFAGAAGRISKASGCVFSNPGDCDMWSVQQNGNGTLIKHYQDGIR